MSKWYQVQISDFVVAGVFLLIGGLVLLVRIDFLWGSFALLVSFYCLWQAFTRHESNTAQQRERVEGG